MTKRIGLRVECAPGPRGEATPQAFSIGDSRVETAAVLDCWPSRDHEYFKVTGKDGGLYILRHDLATGEWELILSEWSGKETAS